MEANNMKAMREACANIAEYAKAAKCHTEDAHTLGFLDQIELWAKAALAAPARNCDVGTAEEQEVRFRNYCWNHSSRDKNMECQCPIDVEGKAGCKLEWSQLPYNESEAGK